jgi:hemolysin activation/secretion protein
MESKMCGRVATGLIAAGVACSGAHAGAMMALAAPMAGYVAGAAALAVGTPPFVPTPQDLQAKPTPPPTPADQLPNPDGAGRPPRELGKPDELLSIDVAAFSVPESAPQALRVALPRLTASFVGKGKSYEDLVNAASEVTRFLQRDLGYYLGYAYIPEQVPQDHVIRIGVLEGRLDRVVLNWDDALPVRREVVQAYLDRLKPGAILTVRDVERAVFLINDLRGISVKAEVKAGDRPGTAILEFTPKAEARFTGKVDADLNGSRFIGITRLGELLTVNSPLGRGDGLSLSGLASTSGGLQFLLLGYNTPLGSDGFKAGVSVSGLKYKLDPTLFPLGLDGQGVSVNAFGLYPWVRSRNLNLFMLLAADDKRYTDSVAGVPTNKRVDDGTLGLTGDFRDSFATGGVNTFDLNLARGRLSYEGGLPAGIDDSPNYTKLGFSFTRLQNIVDERWLAYLSVHGQVALDNLDTTEQFRAGGPDGVRAFAPGEGTGDSGVVLTTELRWLPPEILFGRWAREFVFAAFVDAADVVFRHDASLLVRPPTYVNHASYVGAGLSFVWARPGSYSLRMSLASPVSGKATGDTLVRNPRLYLEGSLPF